MTIRQSVFSVHVRYMLSPVRLSVVCLSVCNVLAPYSGDFTCTDFGSFMVRPMPTTSSHHTCSSLDVSCQSQQWCTDELYPTNDGQGKCINWKDEEDKEKKDINLTNANAVSVCNRLLTSWHIADKLVPI